MTHEARSPEHGAATATGCARCAAAWSVTADARTKQRAAEADAERARESERLAYAAAQHSLDQLDAARREIQRVHALLRTARPRPHRTTAHSERQEQR
jgi:hypothetical protein